MSNWLNFDRYGLRLVLARAKEEQHYLILAGEVGDDVRKYAEQAKNLGFSVHPKEKHLLVRRVRMRPDGELFEGIDPAKYMKHFPQAYVVERDMGLHFRDISGAAPSPGTSNDGSGEQARPVASSVTLGLNRLGREVYQTDGERWFRDERGNSLYERDSSGSPAVFLRAPTWDALVECCEGVVERAWRSKQVDAEEIDKLKGVFGWTGSDEDFSRAMAQALAVWSARRESKTMQEAFVNASRLSEGLDHRVPGTPLTIATAVQRAIGTEATLRGRKVVIRSDSPGVFATHAFRSSLLTLSLPAKGDTDSAKSVLAAAKVKAEVVSGDLDASAHGLVLDVPAKTGSNGRRVDLDEIELALEAREEDGVAILIMDAPSSPEQIAQFESFRSRLAAGYVYEGEAVVDTSLSGDGRERVLISVGRRLDEPAVDAFPTNPIRVGEWSSLWTWTTEAVARRAAARKVVVASDTEVSFNAGEGDRNTYQTPYVSASASGTPRTMVPRNLEGAMRDALSNIVRIYGDVDAFVAKEFFYEKDELSEIFSPEQIDAMALHVHAERRGRGFLNGDQTGIGKGRFLAACIRRQIMNGKKAVFLTERETNLSDIWRDIKATRSDHLVKPMILNADATIIDVQSKEVVHRGTPSDIMDAALASGEIPEAFNLVMGTYSQLNRDVKAPYVLGGKDVAAKPRWLAEAVNGEVSLFLDESHNAAGDGNTAQNVANIVSSAGAVVYSSATFAADARRMSFYAPLFPDDIKANELSSMLQKGGEVFQEVISSMLVKDGVMVRREFDLSKLTVETVIDTARFERNRELMDSVAPILGELAHLSDGVEHRIRQLNAEMQGRQVRDDGGDKEIRLSRSGFGSPLYTISRLFVAALKVDIVAEDAIKVLESGGKPIILVENTMQQLFEELAEHSDPDQAGISVDMKALLNRIVRNMTTVSHVNAKNEKVYRSITKGVESLEAQMMRIKRMIDSMPDLSLSVIDDVKDRVEKAGYTIGEITGRTLTFHEGRIKRRTIPNATEVKNDFNDGVLDAIVINVSGATGIDLHASKTFQDQRQRFMLELQPPADVVRKMQARGRPNRYDQVIEPIIRTYLSGLPVEMRLAAMDNAKLRKLSANTTSNRDTAQLTRDVPDLINPIGDLVCSRYAESRPELMRRLGFRIGQVERTANDNSDVEKATAVALLNQIRPSDDDTGAKKASGVADSSRTANEILARLIMLPVDVQTKVCDELIAEFNAAVEEMEARGETPLRASEMPGIVHPHDTRIFDGADVENPDSVFHEPLLAVEAALERVAEPMDSTDLSERIELGELASGRAQPCIDRLRDGIEEILAPYLPEGVANLADAINRNLKDIVERKANLDRLAEVLSDLRPGKEICFTIDDTPTHGIVTRVEYPNRGYEHVMGMYGVEFACPGDEKPRLMRLTTLIKDKNFRIDAGLESEDYDAKLKRFDNAVKSKLSKVQMLTNNIYRAMRLNIEYNFGPLVVYRNADGVVHRGIAVSKRFHSMKAIPVEISSPDMAFDGVMNNGIELNAASALDEKTFSIRKLNATTAEIRLPLRGSRKYGHIYDDPFIVDLHGQGRDEGRKGVVVEVERRQLETVLRSLYASGARFWTIPANRKWALDWHNAKDEEPVVAIAAGM